MEYDTFLPWDYLSVLHTHTYMQLFDLKNMKTLKESADRDDAVRTLLATLLNNSLLAPEWTCEAGCSRPSFSTACWFQEDPETLCSIRCAHAQVMKSTKYTARWSVGMCRVKPGSPQARPLSAEGPSKPCFALEADDWPPECGGSSRRTQLGIKAAISTPFLSWWVEIWAKTNPPSPLQLCPLLSTKESSKDILNTLNQIFEL